MGLTTGATISVAIASYNGARHIREQLDSIAGQTRRPDELVVADDRSTDDTRAIVAQFAATAPFPVRLIRHEANIGILENFHSAFAACTGDFLYYCDQDDSWRADKIERVQAAFDERTMLVTHQSEITDGALVGQGRTGPGNPVYGRLAEPVDALAAGGWGHQMAFRRAVFTLMRTLKPLVEHAAIHDLANNFDGYIPFCASLLGDIVTLPDPLTLFRRHDAATSGAGLATARAEGRTVARRGAQLIAQEVHAARSRLALIADARRAGAIGDEVGRRVEQALIRQGERAAALTAAATGRTRIGRAAALPAALLAAARPTGFTNDRPRRMAAVAIAMALTGPPGDA